MNNHCKKRKMLGGEGDNKTLIEKINKLEKIIKEQAKTINNTTNNNCNNTINQILIYFNGDVNIVSLGQENLEKILTADNIKKHILKDEHLFRNLIELVNFNKKHPQNHNIVKPNKREDTIILIEDGKPRLEQLTNVLGKIYSGKLEYMKNLPKEEYDKLTKKEKELIDKHEFFYKECWTKENTQETANTLYENRKNGNRHTKKKNKYDDQKINGGMEKI